MSTVKAIQLNCQAEGETRLHAISFVGKLDSGELLTGTPTITEVTNSYLTITNKAVNTAVLTINGNSVAIGQAVQCLITGVQDGITHEVKIVVGTDSTPAQTLVGVIRIEGIADTD